MEAQVKSKSVLMSSMNFSGNLSEGCSVEVLGDALTGYIVNVVREKGEEPVRIPPSISGKLKGHQVFILHCTSFSLEDFKFISFCWEPVTSDNSCAHWSMSSLYLDI